MAKLSRSARNVLSARAVQLAKAPKLYPDGGNLYLRVKKVGTKSWIFRYWRKGKDVWMGLGGYPDVSLADARLMAEQHRRELRDKEDPMFVRNERHAETIRKQAEAEAAEAKKKTFAECRVEFIDSNEAEWTSTKHRNQWVNTVKTYAEPTIGDMYVSDIQTSHVVSILQPIWRTKTVTASRVRQRIERVLDYAKGMGFREGDNPASWRGNLEALLPKPTKVAKKRNLPAMPYAEMPDFMALIRSLESLSAIALEFTILNAARTGEVIAARWSEIVDGVWLIPVDRMKSGREHRVPLSDAALLCIEKLPQMDSYIFPGQGKNAHLSNMAMLRLLRGMITANYTVHGFRSSFRDWAADTTNTPNHIAEMALAHSIGNEVEATYRRGELLEKRRVLMSRWAQYLSAEQENKVVQLK